MAVGENGRENPGLTGRLFREPHRFDFFQAVRLLERWVRITRHPVGRDRAPEQEAVRFRSQTALHFPSAAVSGLRAPATKSGEPDEALPPPDMVVTFLGLFGPAGVLPHHYTTLLTRRLRDKDTSLRDWLDVFNHRLTSLFFRAWEKYRLPFTFEAGALAGGEPDPVTRGLYCLVGLGTDRLRGRLAPHDLAFLYYAGHFAHYPRTATALEGILTDYFDMPAAVLELQGHWLLLDADDQARLPDRRYRNGRNVGLGVDLVVGERVWDVQSQFRVRLGPLSYDQFRRFMPDGDGLRPLGHLTRTYVGTELSFDVQLVLRPGEAPPCRLGGDGEPGLLGWNTWVFCGDLPRAVDDAVFSLADV
jgi:type VI secretion system protein ImpH